MSKFSHILREVGRQIQIITVALILCLFPFPLLLLIVIPSVFLRTIVKALARCLRPDLSEIFSGKGVLFALESVYTRPKLSILLHFVFDGSLQLDVLRRRCQEKLINECDYKGDLKYPQLRQRWTTFLSFLFWQWDKTFSVDNHVKIYDHKEPHLAIPSPCTEDDLKRVTGHLIAKPFAEGRSPWEIILIPEYRSSTNVSGQKQTAIVLRIHHAMADGYSLLKMLFHLFDLEGTKVAQPRFPSLTLRQRIVQSVILPLRLPYDVAESLVDSFDGSNSWHLFNTKLSRQYYTFFSDQIPVAQIKEIKRKYRVGYNAVVYALTAGGIRRLMQEAGQKIPRKMSCFVPFPLPKHPGGLVLHVSGIFFKFSPRIHSAEKRLEEISQNLSNVASAPTVPIIMSWVTNLISLMPTWGLKIIYNKLMMTTAMTSFPGPENYVDVTETAKLVDIIPALGHMAGHLGSVTTLVSLGGKQRIVLTVDKDIFAAYEVPANFAKHINDEIQALLYPSGKSEGDEV